MKVKEYIEELKKLDPERNIWQANDDNGFACIPNLPEVVDENELNCYDEDAVKAGDYFIRDIK